MTHDEAIAAIRETAEAVGGESRGDYSGGGMFGRTCWGIDCDGAVECIAEAARHGLPTPKIDSVGRGWIVYWPGVTGDEAAGAGRGVAGLTRD